MKLTIQDKLVVLIFMTILLVGCGIALYSFFGEREQIHTSFKREAYRIADLISKRAADSIYFLDIERLTQLLNSAKSNPHIQEIYVTDLEGALLADGTDDNPRRDQKIMDPFAVGARQGTGWLDAREGNVVRIGGPILLPDQSTAGYLLMALSLKGPYSEVQERALRIFLFTFFCFGIGLLIAFFSARHFSRPIRLLTDASKEIRAGELDVRIPVRRSDELDDLARSIEAMAENLKNTMVSRDKLVKEVAERIKAAEELKKTHAELIQMARLATVGTLASGIAHEVNNPLQAVLGNLETIGLILRKRGGTSSNEIGEILVESRQAIERCRQITHGLLQFARPSSIHNEKVDLRNIIQEAIQLTHVQLEETNISTKTTLPPRIPPVMGNSRELTQVLVNLITNATRAMRESKERRLSIGTTVSNGVVALSVRDTGQGILEENLPRIFDPFFTTSYEDADEKFKGMGLGLSICRRIIEEHKGSIEVQSQPMSGSTFTVILPVTE